MLSTVDIISILEKINIKQIASSHRHCGMQLFVPNLGTYFCHNIPQLAHVHNWSSVVKLFSSMMNLGSV